MIIFNHLRVKRILLSDRYSLAAKFQLQENLKAFKVYRLNISFKLYKLFQFLLLIIVWIVTGFGCAGLVMLYRRLQ